MGTEALRSHQTNIQLVAELGTTQVGRLLIDWSSGYPPIPYTVRLLPVGLEHAYQSLVSADLAHHV